MKTRFPLLTIYLTLVYLLHFPRCILATSLNDITTMTGGDLKHRTTALDTWKSAVACDGNNDNNSSSDRSLESGRSFPPLTGGGSTDDSSSDTMAFLTKVRRTVFPIHGKEEVQKFLLIGSIKFFIILALTLTRDLKDTLVVTQCGAEAIAFLKIYGVLPAATAFIAFYSKMASLLEKRTLFYCTCVPFFSFFVLFNVFIFPNAGSIQPSLEWSQELLGGATTGGRAVVAKIMSNWSSALYYVIAEIYSSVSVGVLFWQFANDVVPVAQAKRFYPLFAQMSGLAPVFAGQYVARYASKAENFSTSLNRLTAAVTVSGIMICTFYYLSNAYLDRTETKRGATLGTDGTAEAMVNKKSKPKLSMKESAKFLASNQYLRLIAMLVLGYGLSINFTEVMWKSLVKKQYSDPLDYQRFMGNFSSMVGMATCIVIFFGVHVIRILGWRVGALTTPVVMAVLGIPFFACIFMGLDSPARLGLAVWVGTIQSLLSKTSKYALFDPTTQMAYIPLDDESKVKGKAAIDVLGSRLGKSGGSLIQQGLVFVFGSILDAAPVVAMIFYSVLFTWASSANRLSGMFLARTEVNKAEEHEGKKE
mmetsp:Transcript_30177/g.66827  ORF Transcript_30177/g.66827 Transcript_30177/m.66827 type:complete len:590 (-) Transcript_30177:63-1832(-)